VFLRALGLHDAAREPSGIGPNSVIGRDVRLAEMMIAKRLHLDRDALARPGTGLKPC
jgi:hypothetical protein